MSTERSIAIAGLAIVVAVCAAAGARHDDSTSSVNRARDGAAHIAIAGPRYVAVPVPDADALIGRPHDGAATERILREWSRDVRRNAKRVRPARR